MRINVIRKSTSMALCSGVLVGSLFAAGCSDRPTSGNKLDDPELKANMKPIWDQFKAKTQEMKDKTKKGSSKGLGRP
jgi:hypothetical protein